MLIKTLKLTTILLSVFVTSCIPVAQHSKDVNNAVNDSDRLTVGTVQREVRIGMSSADVVSVLGAPNMVTTDSKRREQWVYDKISTQTAYSTSSGGINALTLGGGVVGSAIAGGGVGAGYGSSTGASSTSQRTLTIIIKYDENSLVRDFAYRSSSF